MLGAFQEQYQHQPVKKYWHFLQASPTLTKGWTCCISTWIIPNLQTHFQGFYCSCWKGPRVLLHFEVAQDQSLTLLLPSCPGLSLVPVSTSIPVPAALCPLQQGECRAQGCPSMSHNRQLPVLTGTQASLTEAQHSASPYTNTVKILPNVINQRIILNKGMW